MKSVLLMALLFMVTGLSAGDNVWFDGNWYTVKCYGCPADLLGNTASVEINIQKEKYNAAKGSKEDGTDYREPDNFTVDRVNEVSDAALSSAASAWPWINLANYLIHDAPFAKKDYVTAKSAVKKAQAILDKAADLEEDPAKLNPQNEDLRSGWAVWNKRENKQRARIRTLIDRRIAALKNLKAWEEQE